ncbi:MAG: hypothetical protein D6732_09435 [Methanobacteriota archaeon]|nr:MAG: hypothetical protein D6732_09435 [Euryarchaeota archaeon]
MATIVKLIITNERGLLAKRNHGGIYDFPKDGSMPNEYARETVERMCKYLRITPKNITTNGILRRKYDFYIFFNVEPEEDISNHEMFVSYQDFIDNCESEFAFLAKLEQEREQSI